MFILWIVAIVLFFAKSFGWSGVHCPVGRDDGSEENHQSHKPPGNEQAADEAYRLEVSAVVIGVQLHLGESPVNGCGEGGDKKQYQFTFAYDSAEDVGACGSVGLADGYFRPRKMLRARKAAPMK